MGTVSSGALCKATATTLAMTRIAAYCGIALSRACVATAPSSGGRQEFLILQGHMRTAHLVSGAFWWQVMFEAVGHMMEYPCKTAGLKPHRLIESRGFLRSLPISNKPNSLVYTGLGGESHLCTFARQEVGSRGLSSPTAHGDGCLHPHPNKAA